MILSKTIARVLLIAICLAPALASGDDFAPPPWPRTDVGAITAEWEFFTPANPTAPDGPLTNVFAKGSGTVATSAVIFGPGIGWGGTSGGNWFFPGDGGIRFRVDNVIDFEPIKHLRVQVTSTPGMGLIIDPLAAFNLGSTGSFPGPVSSSTSIVTGPFGPVAHTLFTWDMFPNPPWEDFTLLIGGPGEIRQVVVDTISTAIPEPATFVWYGIALVFLGLIFHTCPRFWSQTFNQLTASGNSTQS